MDPGQPEIEGASIVLIGSFNPAILHPEWLAARSLIRSEEAEAGKVEIVSRQLTVFRLTWLELQVQDNRFAAHTTDPAHYQTLQELVLGIFNFLEFTPIEQMGMNHHMHFSMEREDDWHKLGDILAPKDVWRDVLPGLRSDGLPGLRTLVMEGRREGSPAKLARIKVEPSVRLVPGVFFESNEHYEASGTESTAQLLGALRDCWRDAHVFSRTIGEHLMRSTSR